MFELSFGIITKICGTDGLCIRNETDGMDAFWEYLSYYSTNDNYGADLHTEKVKWLFDKRIPFTVEVTAVKEHFTGSYYYEDLFFRINITNPKDAMFFKLKFL